MPYTPTQVLLRTPSPQFIAGVLLCVFLASFPLIFTLGAAGLYAALCVPLVLLLPWLHPLLLFSAYLATLYWTGLIVPGTGISANQILAPAFFVSAFLFRFWGNGLRIGQPLIVFLGLFSIYFAMNALLGQDFERGAVHARYVIVYLILALSVAVSLSSERAILGFAWIVVLLSGGAAVIGLVEAAEKNIFSGIQGNFGYERRVAGTAPNPIVYGWHMAYTLPFGFLLFSQLQEVRWRLTALALTLLVTFAAFLTFNRQTYIVIAILLGLGGWLYVFKNRRLVLTFLAVMGAAGLVAILPALVRRFGSVGNLSRDYSFLERADSFKIGMEMFQQHRLFGVGLGSFPAIWKEYIPPDYTTFFAQYSAPSRLRFPDFGYIAMLVETGLVGLALYLALHLIIVLRAWKYRRQALAAGDTLAANVSATVLCLCAFVAATTAIQDTFLYPRVWIMYGLALLLHPRLLAIRPVSSGKHSL